MGVVPPLVVCTAVVAATVVVTEDDTENVGLGIIALAISVGVTYDTSIPDTPDET